MNTTQLSTWLPSFAAPFVTLSYPVPTPPHPDSFPDSSYYDIGRLDACFVVTCIVLMAVARDISRLYILEPAARWKLMRDAKNAKRKEKKTNRRANGALNGNGHANGHANGDVSLPNGGSKAVYFTPRERKEMHRKVLRFAEQGWDVIYYILQWSYGLVSSPLAWYEAFVISCVPAQYVYLNTPASPIKTDNLWIGYPHFPLAGPVKLYYLTQAAFYTHSVFVLNAEAHRADHIQMMTHHVITIALMLTSYFYNFTRVGCMIMVLMDWCDIWLPVRLLQFNYRERPTTILTCLPLARQNVPVHKLADDLRRDLYLVPAVMARHPTRILCTHHLLAVRSTR